MKNNYIKEIIIKPAFDKRNPDPAKDYGIHGCNMIFYLKGPKGVAHFVISTNWHLPHVAEYLLANSLIDLDFKCRFFPIPAELGYHSPVPIYKGQSKTKCNIFEQGYCYYYDGSIDAARKVYRILLTSGSDGTWKKLEEECERHFGNDNDKSE